MNKQSGQSAIVIPILVALTAGVLYFFNQSATSASGLKYVIVKSMVHSHANIVFEKVGKQLAQAKSECFEIAPIFNFKSTDTVIIKDDSIANLQSCFIGDKKSEIYQTYHLEITKIPRADDALTGTTAVRVSLLLQTKSMQSAPSVNFKQEKIFNISISKSAPFALIFRGSQPLVRASSGSRVFVFGDVMHSRDDENVNLSKMIEPAVQDLIPTLQVNGRFLTRKSLLVTQSDDHDIIMSGFKRGIFTNFMSEVQNYPFDGYNEAWNQNIDYSYVYLSYAGYPLPANINSAHAANGDQAVNTNLAAVKSLPDSRIIPDLSQTCTKPDDASRGDSKPMIVLQRDSDINLDLSNSKMFCGMIAARQLNVNLGSGGGNYLLIGHFNVGQLNVTGTGRLFVINPFSQIDMPVDIQLPPDMNLQEIAKQLFALRATIAKNFFVPYFNQTATVGAEYQPILISSFFLPCPALPTGPSGGNYFCWKPSVSILNYDNLYLQTDWSHSVRFLVGKGM